MINRALYRVWLRYAAFEIVEGFPIADLARGDRSARANSLRGAVRLLGQVQPYRLAQARRYLRRLVVSYTGGSGEYWYGMGVCILDAEYMQASEPVAIAMLLLHETTHARLDSCRIRTTRRNVSRVEHLCARVEIDFGSRIVGAEPYVERVRRALDNRWWEPEQSRARQRRRLAQSRVPAWALRFYDRLIGPHSEG